MYFNTPKHAGATVLPRGMVRSDGDYQFTLRRFPYSQVRLGGGVGEPWDHSPSREARPNTRALAHRPVSWLAEFRVSAAERLRRQGDLHSREGRRGGYGRNAAGSAA